MKWRDLRVIQIESINAVQGTSDHLLVCANTASGKTEAAFLPTLSSIIDDSRPGVKIAYVSPLKALINDQFRRLEQLCQRTGIEIHKWHGDVGTGKKRELVRSPSGVLLITPESLESIFINRAPDVPKLFQGLQFIVIDEIHSFIDSERGIHLCSLLRRVERVSGTAVRRIGLSATVGDPSEVCRWMEPESPESVQVVRDQGRPRRVLLQVKTYLCNPARDRDEGGEFSDPEEERFLDDLMRYFYGKSALVFTRSRAMAELCADQMRERCEANRLPHRFLIHHGSLSKTVREDAEFRLKSGEPVAAFCSATLEMGIDIGSVTEVGVIDPPWSVSSLVQRLGRSGRKEGQSAILRYFTLERYRSPDDRIVAQLHPKLLQAVAMVELMLEGWCEPFAAHRLHLSTLMQQVMSVIASTGGATPVELFDALVKRGAFRHISQTMFLDVLRSMGSHDLLEQSRDGSLILGLLGERIARSFEFYSAFVTPDDYKVRCAGRHVGSVSIDQGIDADSHIILAGRRWRVISVDHDALVLDVEPAAGGRLPAFEGGLGAEIHPRIRETMKAVLFSKEHAAFLDAPAQRVLASARELAEKLNLNEHVFLKDGNELFWFTWTGSRINRTLAALGRFYGGFHVSDDEIGLSFSGASAGDVEAFYREVLSTSITGEELASKFPVKTAEKYDKFLSDDLQNASVAAASLDMPGAVTAIKKAFL